MSNSALTSLAVLATVLAVAAVAMSVLPLREALARRRRAATSPLPTDVAGLRDEVERLRTDEEGSLRHLALVRYDAFGDMGGRLSWSLALADDRGDGIVLTSIAGRSDARTYAKNIEGWASEQQLSPEEQEAVAEAKAAG
jgi:hypothetical protein